MTRVRILLLLSMLVPLVGCGLPPAGPTPTRGEQPTPVISEGEARQRAIVATAQGGPELETAVTPPQVESAQLTTWSIAGETHTLPEIADIAPSTAVWVIRLSGVWVGGMPAPEITPTPALYHTALAILNAASGEVLLIQHGP